MFSISAFFALFTLTVLMIPAIGGNDSFGSVSINNNTSSITLSVLQQPKIQKFNSCRDSQKYKLFVQNDLDLALSFGFRETPSH
jgi:hypothetical protein